MAQLVTLMIASRGCSICGSGTESQRISVVPCQTSAFIEVSSNMNGNGQAPPLGRPCQGKTSGRAVCSLKRRKNRPSLRCGKQLDMPGQRPDEIGKRRFQHLVCSVLHLEPPGLPLPLLAPGFKLLGD